MFLTTALLTIMVICFLAAAYFKGVQDGYKCGNIEGIDEGRMQVLKEDIARIDAQHRRLSEMPLPVTQGSEDALTLKAMIKEIKHHV